MKWLLIAVLIFAQQPTKAPESQRTAESNNAKSTPTSKQGATNQKQSNISLPPPTQTPVVTEGQRSAATADSHATQAAQQTSEEDRKTQIYLTWFTGVLAAVGALQLAVMFLTWTVYRRQAREMRRQRHEMRRQRHVMFRQWRAMGDQLETMRSQSGILEKSVAAAEKSADAAKNSLVTMREANNINLESLQSVQRAYISFMIFDLQTFSIADAAAGRIEKRELRVGIENTGNTPAIELTDRINYRWEPGENDLLDDFAFPDLGNEITSVGTLAAKGKIYSPKLTINESVIQDVYAGRARLFLYGWAEYRDVFTGTARHRTEFCYEFKIRELSYERMIAEITMYPRHNTQT